VAFIAAQILGLGLALIAIRLQAPGRTV
jgi:hypothetical protein